MEDNLEELAADISRWISEPLTLVEEPRDLIGSWHSSNFEFAREDAGDYIFAADGTVKSRWCREAEWVVTPFDVCEPGVLCLFHSNEDSDQFWEFRATEALFYAFRAESGRIVLSNSDTSILRILTRVTLP